MTRQWKPCKFTDLPWCSSIGEVSGNFFQHLVCMHIWLQCTCISSTFFRFLSVFLLSSRRNWKKYLFSSFFHSFRRKPISFGSFWTLATNLGRGTQIWFGQGCSAGPAKLLPIIHVRVIFVDVKTWKFGLDHKNKPIVRDNFVENGTHV